MATPRREEKKARERAARAARARAARRKRNIRVLTAFGVIIVVLGLVAGSIQLFSGNSSNNAASTTTTTVPTTPCPAADGSSPRTIDFKYGMANCLDAGKKYTATFDTTEGTVVVDLDTTKTPGTANNFVALARYHYYDGTTIFRTDPSIDIIQGGSPHTESASDQGPGYNIKDEGTGFKYTAGDLVMARGSDGASAQFFFGTGPNVSQLDNQGNYVTFGHASQGLDVLQKIIGLHVATSDGLGGKPSRTVTINKVTIAEA